MPTVEQEDTIVFSLRVKTWIARAAKVEAKRLGITRNKMLTILLENAVKKMAEGRTGNNGRD